MTVVLDMRRTIRKAIDRLKAALKVSIVSGSKKRAGKRDIAEFEKYIRARPELWKSEHDWMCALELFAKALETLGFSSVEAIDKHINYQCVSYPDPRV